MKLADLNNQRFAPDGSLMAIGYDGRVWRHRIVLIASNRTTVPATRA